MNPTKTITRAQLREKIAALKGATFVTISALTDARAKKTGVTQTPAVRPMHGELISVPGVAVESKVTNPFASVFKLSKVNGTIGANYEASVNRQLGREGKDQLTFKAKERSWGEHETSALIVKGEGAEQKAYLAIQPRSTRRLAYFGQTVAGVLRQVTPEAVAPFMPAYRPPTNQGTDKAVEYRTYGLESITAITMGGESFRIRDNTPKVTAPKVKRPLSKDFRNMVEMTKEMNAIANERPE